MNTIKKIVMSILSLVLGCVLFFIILNYSVIVASVAAATSVGAGVFALFTRTNQSTVSKVIGSTIAIIVACLVGVLLIKVSPIIAAIASVLAIGIGIYVSIKGNDVSV